MNRAVSTLTATEKHSRQGSTPRTHKLATRAAEQVYTRWDEWRQLNAQYAGEDIPNEAERYSRQFAEVWSHMGPWIREDELIVGARRRLPEDLPGAADGVGSWVPDGYAEVEQWAQKSPPHRPDIRAMADRSLISPLVAQCHRVADFPAVMRLGARALIAHAHELAATREGESRAFTLSIATGFEAVITYARRHAEEARRLAADTTDLQRAAELREIARICDKVPAEAPETFHEAVQSYWFLYLVCGCDLGRLDQTLYEYYARDLAAGRITPERALELLECLLIKAHLDFLEADCNVSSVHTLTLAGMTPDGADASNDLTRLLLQAIRNIRLSRPTVYLRCHTGTPDDIIATGVALLAEGLAEPSFYGDAPIIDGLVRVGVPIEEARNYALGGCTEVVSSGKGNWGAPNGWMNLALLADDALRAAAQQGVQDFEDFWHVLESQIETLAEACRDSTLWLDEQAQPVYPTSLMMPCCLKSGADTAFGGADTNLAQWAGVGLPNAADMLYTANALAFSGTASLAELFARLDEGDEILRTQIRALPKFGQGCPEVDAIARRFITMLSEALERQTTPLRAHLVLGHLSGGQNMHIDDGRYMGASLDGRAAGQPLADSLAGMQGQAKWGATAMLHSICALDHSRLQAGNVTTLMLSPADFQGETGQRNIVALIKSYIAMGGSQLQFNLVDAEILRRAQREPEAHRGLMVRVAGYSAEFTHIGPTLQEEIISRIPSRN